MTDAWGGCIQELQAADGLRRGYAMSPVPTATQARRVAQTVPQVPYPPADLVLRLGKEIVVDWQLPSDMERKN